MATKRPASQQPLSGQPHLKRRETGNNSPRPSGASSPAVTSTVSDPKACLNALLGITAALATAEVELSVVRSQHTQANEDVIDAKKRKNFSSYLEIKQRYALQKLADLRQCQDKVDTLQGKKNTVSESFIATIQSPNEDDLLSKIMKRLDSDLNMRIRNATAGFEEQIDRQISQHKSEIVQLQDEIKRLSTSSDAARQISNVTSEVKQLRDSLTGLSKEHIKGRDETKSDIGRLAENILTLKKDLESFQPSLDSIDAVMQKMPERILKVESKVFLIRDEVNKHTVQLKELDGRYRAPLPNSTSEVQEKRFDKLEKHAENMVEQMEEMRGLIEVSHEALDLLTGKPNEVGVLERLGNAEESLRALPDVNHIIDSVNAVEIKVAALDSLQADCDQEFESLTIEKKNLSARVQILEDRDYTSILHGNVKPLESFIRSVETRVHEHSKRLDTYSSEVADVKASNAGNAQIAICYERVQKVESAITSLKQDVEALPSQTIQSSTDVVKKEEFEALQAEAKTIKRDTDHHIATFGAVQQAVQHLEARVNNTTTEHISSMLDRWLWDHGQKSLRNLFAPIKVVGEVEALSSENDSRAKDGKALRAHVDNIDHRLKTSFENLKRHVEQLPQVDSSVNELPQKVAQLFLSVDNMKLRTTNLAQLEIEIKRLGQKLTQTSASEETSNRIKDQISGLTEKVENGLKEIEQVSEAVTQVREDLSTAKTDIEKRRQADLVVTTDQLKQIEKEYKAQQETIRRFRENLKEALEEVEKKVEENASSFKDDYDARANIFDERFNTMAAAQFRNASKETVDKLQKRVDELITFKKSVEGWQTQLEPEKVQKVINDVEELQKRLDQVKQDQEAATASSIPTGPRASASDFSIKGAALREQASRATPATISTSNRSTSIARAPSSGNRLSQGPFLNTPTPRQTTVPQLQAFTANSRPATPATTVGQSSAAIASSSKNNSFQPRIKREMTNISSSSFDSGRNTPGPSTSKDAKLARKQKKGKKNNALENRKDVELFDLTTMGSNDNEEGEDPLSTTRPREATEEL